MENELKVLARLASIVLVTLLFVVGVEGAQQTLLAAEKAAEVKPAKVRWMLQEGIQLIPLEIMQKKGVAKKYQLQIEPVIVTGPQGVYTVMQIGDFDTAVASWIPTALLRGKGHKVTVAYSMHGYTNDILVKINSPIKSFADLKGKNIGIFGGPFAGTTWMLRLEMVKYFGFDPIKECKVHYGAPPIMMAMLEKGELDATLLLDPQAVRMLETGNFRSIGNMSEIWHKNTGRYPLHLVIVMNEIWANKNIEVAKRFIAAYKETLEYLKTHTELWPEWAKSSDIKTEQGVKLFQERTANFFFIVKWDQNFINEQYALSNEIFKVFGEVEGFPKQIPDGTFTTAYGP
jgi:NitT/TauT family transport system substrate-binding protein